MSAAPTRVFHGPFNIAGIPGMLAKTERENGLLSQSVCFPAGVYQRDVDRTITSFSAEEAIESFGAYDVFNFHFGHSLFGETLGDLRLLRLAGKRIVMHFHGCDIRDSKRVMQKYAVSACNACFPMACNRNRGAARQAAQELAHAVVLYTPDLLEFVPNGVWVPQPVDMEALRATAAAHPPAERDERLIRIVHAPSAVDLKGSRFIIEACERLQAEGAPVELELVTGRPHGEVVRAVAGADLVVDQVLFGAYGVFAVEAMALGKPVVCYIREDVKPAYPEDLPIVNASPADIYDVLKALVASPEQLAPLGRRSRAYADCYHDRVAVSAQVRRLYQ